MTKFKRGMRVVLAGTPGMTVWVVGAVDKQGYASIASVDFPETRMVVHSNELRSVKPYAAVLERLEKGL